MSDFRSTTTVDEVNAAIKDDYCGHYRGAPFAASVVVANSYCYDKWGTERQGYDDDESFVVYLDKVSNYYVLWESSDSTGHGCRCSGGVAGPFPTLKDAVLLGLTADQRDGLDQLGFAWDREA